MSEREELEAVAKALAEDDGQMWEGLSLQDHYRRQAVAARTALISSGYTKGNGELVAAVREMVANDGDVGSQQYDARLFINARARVVKALSDSEATNGGRGDG